MHIKNVHYPEVFQMFVYGRLSSFRKLNLNEHMIRMYKSTFSSSFATESSSFSTASIHPNTTENILAVRAPFKREEIVLGSFLGSGEFSNVYEIEAFCTKGDVMNEDETRQRESMALRNKYALTGKARYALKHIKVDYQHQGSHSEALYIQATR